VQTELLRARADLLGLMRSVRPGTTLALLLAVLAGALLPAVFAVATGVMVDRVPDAVNEGLGSAPGRDLLVALGVVAALLVLERVLMPVSEAIKTLAGRQIDAELRGEVLEALERPGGIAHLEDASTLDRINTMKGSLFGSAGTAAVAALVIVGRYVQTAAALAVVAWFSVWLALVVGVIVVVIRRRWHRAFGELADALMRSGGDLREVTYTVDLAVLPPGAKELRVFGLLDWLIERARVLWDRAVEAPFGVRARLRRSANIELAAIGAAYLLTFVLLAQAAVRGDVALGVVAAVLQAVFSAAQLIAPTGDDFATAPGQAALRSAREVIDTAERAPRPTGQDTASGLPRRKIRFHDVAFSYPGSDIAVLDGLDLTIGAGESLALVGLNGAGKTTLVKLLCGLYQPTRGRITIDGTELEALELGEWRSRIGVIFQDFVHYELSAADNIAFGAPHTDQDHDAVVRAAERAGIRDAIEALPQGWDTVLSRQYDQGGELSGGQWQRIALARALYAVDAGAGVLVLDEPTANLDVRAEADLFDQFLQWTDDVTSLLISHRFSTVRRANRIAVLDDGRIVESGTHEELLASGGRYEALFRLQAAQYTASNEPGAATDA
jgi:ATP-binding cassette subfamily B protein